ncbi:MAG: hypothetical protein J5966_07515, partial [Lachnospiraceae bacterium]|nr:hypothetical protein [Lachnospiraceae bacterium]
MRPVIAPENYKGRYYDDIKAEDLIIMGGDPGEIAGEIGLEDGICKGLWQLSLETGLGMIVDIRRIGIPQTYINECNRAD